MKPHDFQGVLYDILEEIVIDRAPVIRATYAEAMADAKAMAEQTNLSAEMWDDDADGNATVGRVDDSYCFVLIDGFIAYSEAEVA